MDVESDASFSLPVLPAGTVTFIFTDIEGSTELLKLLGDRYATVLADHRGILRRVLSRWDGKEVDTQGDSFFISFSRATNAVGAAVEVQRAMSDHSWPDGVEVRLRIGLHTGEPLVAEDGYVGLDVHRAARIGNVGHGGQVLLSETTAALVMDELPEGVGLMDLGLHRLKDVRRPERIRQLVIENLPTEFPPLKSLEAVASAEPGDHAKHNLPAVLTKFIGREEELVSIRDLLQEQSIRFVTLKGVGGIGKTRLALQTAAPLIDAYPDGVWLIEFANLTDPALVSTFASSIFGVSVQESKDGRDVGTILATYLRERKLLIILDNCEHLIEACAMLAERLLRNCPDVQLLATSREVLGVPGEKVFQVLPMHVPPDGATQEELDTFESASLFIERARRASPGFRLTEENFPSVIRICQHLDGIPLAIELAAARVKILTPEQIIERLKDRFQLLAGGPRTALPRHQTLQAAMEWSYSLLTESEKKLFNRLSVFSGGWSLEDAEGVIQDAQERGTDILEILSALIDKSLVVVERRGGIARYRMLETVRQFAAEKLSSSGEEKEISQRHAIHFLELAEKADPGLRSSEQLDWLDRLEDEHENFRAALRWFFDSIQPEAAARLVSALGWYWFLRGYWVEAWNSLTSLLNMGLAPKSYLRAKALYRAGGLELIRGNLSGRVELVEEALNICEENGDAEGMAWCLNLLGQAITFSKEDPDEGIKKLTRSIELFNELENSWGVAWSTRYLGQMVEIQGHFEQAVKLQKEAIEQFEKLGDILNIAHSLYLLGVTYRDHGDFNEAKQMFQESLSKCKIVGDNFMEAHALQGLGMVDVKTGQYLQAEEYLGESLEIMRRIGDQYCASRIYGSMSSIASHAGDLERAIDLQRKSLQGFSELQRGDQIVLGLARLAVLEERRGFEDRAARLLGGAEASYKTSKAVLVLVHLEEYENLIAVFQERKEDEEFARNYELGLRMTTAETIGYALEEIDDF